jgi:hypothetical protein
MRVRPTNFIALSLSAILLATPLFATRIRQLTLTETRDRATTIIVADVISAAERLDERGEMVWTDYSLRVAERLKGEDHDETIIVSFAGGKAGGLDIGLAGSPKLTIGSRYLLFLRDGDRLAVPAVGWGQGIFRVSDGALESLNGETVRVTMKGELQKMQLGTRGASEGKRLARPQVLNADGEVVTRMRREVPPAAATTTRRASLEDLRRFIGGSMHERIVKEAQ